MIINVYNQTIYCLLIQPNPDSALNATAGHLLQDDYALFSRQARLMTSIHAPITSELKDAALAAKRRGETTCTAKEEDTEQRPTMNGKPASSLTDVQLERLPEHITPGQSLPSNIYQPVHGENPTNEDDDGISASKENDPLLSPSPVTLPSLQRRSAVKRPLSDLHIGEPEHETTTATCLSPSEQNVVNNEASCKIIHESDSSGNSLRLAGKSQDVTKTSRDLQETGCNTVGIDDCDKRPTKRICSDSGKDDMLEMWGTRRLIEMPLPAASAVTQLEVLNSRTASASSFLGTSSVKGKSRVGLRRL